MRLRAAVQSDLPAILEVQHSGAVRALAHIFPQDAYPFPRAAVQSRWASEIANPGVDVYVIENDEGQVAGFAAVRDNELLHFGTAVETWGTGLAAGRTTFDCLRDSSMINRRPFPRPPAH